MSAEFLVQGPVTAPATLLLAHGAGAAMDSPSISAMAAAIEAAGLRVARFEFGYMAARRTTAGRKPPPRAETLMAEYRDTVAALAATPLLIGGKSMGGRVASMVADELFAAEMIAGLVCLGYPFHPPGRPDQLRTAHLERLQTPTLICQGTRDPFGTVEEVGAYSLSPAIEILWLEDGDHDLRPRPGITGRSAEGHLKTMAGAIRGFADRLARASIVP